MANTQKRRNISIRRLRLLRRIACAGGLAFLLVLGAWAPAAIAQAPAAKRVLLISTGARLAPGFIIVDQQIVQALRDLPTHVDLYPENLDVVRFPAERAQRIFTDYLAEKYADYPPDLVILVFVGNVGIPVSILAELFPSTPIVVAGLTEEALRTDQFGALVGGFAQRTDPGAAVRLIRQLHPDLRRLIIVGGTADIDRHVLRRTEEAVRAFHEQLEIEVWDHLPMSELRRAATALPPQSAVLFTRMFLDGAGQGVISSEVGRWLGQFANAPVYVLSDASLGTGAVGGALASIEAFGARAGALARRILSGTPLDSLPFEIRDDTVAMFDWRALKRWGISESRLPPDSVVRFRQSSIWDQYRWYIIGALLVILVQSATIGGLVVQQRRLRRAQSALRDEQQLIEFATGAGELGLWSRDLATNELWVNLPMRSLFGFDAREPLHRQDILDRVHPDDRARVMAEVEASEAAGRPFQMEYRVRLPGGAERWLLVKGRSLPATAGRGARRMGVILDITEHKQAEERLREAEESVRVERAFLRQVIDANPNFIWAKDLEGRFTLANKALADSYGVAVNELIGKTSADFNKNPDEVRFFRKTDLEVARSGQERFIAEERVTDVRGEVRYLQTVKRPLIGHDGKIHQVLGAATDITQRRRVEIEVQEQRAMIAHVGRVAMMGELAASLAHELNQPLTAILSNAQALLRLIDRAPVDIDEVREALNDIVEANSRAAEVIRRTRALVRKEEGAEFRPIDLAELVHDVVALVRSDAMLHDVSIALNVEEGLQPVCGDRVQLQQVVLNILMNAFDAVKTCPGCARRVEMRLERDDTAMNRVAICDSGPGFGADGLGRIFQPFYTTKREGLGMGLSICRSIIEAHHGRLWAENNSGRGATFYFAIPIYRER
jgi:PAS domain S-box-containing protein